MQHTFVLHTQNSASFVLRTQKSSSKKVGKKGSKKLAKNTPKKHTAIYTTHILITRKKNFLKQIPEPVLLLS